MFEFYVGRRGPLASKATYRASAEAVVAVVEALAEGLGRNTVVTAEHGELFHGGIVAMLGITQHKARLRLPGLVQFP